MHHGNRGANTDDASLDIIYLLKFPGTIYVVNQVDLLYFTVRSMMGRGQTGKVVPGSMAESIKQCTAGVKCSTNGEVHIYSVCI